MPLNPGRSDFLGASADEPTEALDALCTLYRNYLRMVVLTGLDPRLREQVGISDMVQEAILKIVRQFPEFPERDEVAIVGWLRRRMSQQLAEIGRSHGRIASAAAALSFDGAAEPELEPPDTSAGRTLHPIVFSRDSPFQAASLCQLSSLLADLPETEAEVLWLYSFAGLALEEIARRLGVTLPVVRALWARGLRSLNPCRDRSVPMSFLTGQVMSVDGVSCFGSNEGETRPCGR
jgi:RNA polymerase sigma-70 factor (ECF subfamily)